MDDIERRLRDLGDRTAEKFVHGPTPSSQVVRRARLRKGLTAFGSLTLVALIAVGGYAAVGTFGEGSSRPTVEGDVLAAAARTTEEQGSARLEIEMAGQSDGAFSQDFEFHGTGEVDFIADRSYMRLEVEGDDTQGISELELITDGTTMYMKGTFGTSDKWLKTDFADSAEDSPAMGMDQMSGAGVLDYLKSVSDDVEILGREKLDGVRVTHYHATIDSAQAADAGVASTDVWIDEQALVRKMSFDSSFETGGMSMGMSLEMRLFDYGVPVDIELPNPDDVTEDLAEASGSSESGEIEQSILSGEDEWHEPVLLINLGLTNREVCLFGHDEGTKGAQIIEESTGEVFAAIEDMEEAAPAGDLGEEVVCFPNVPEDLTPLLDHPKRYTLQVTGTEGTTNVPLMFRQSMSDPDDTMDD